jgi:hypothetical protein
MVFRKNHPQRRREEYTKVQNLFVFIRLASWMAIGAEMMASQSADCKVIGTVFGVLISQVKGVHFLGGGGFL